MVTRSAVPSIVAAPAGICAERRYTYMSVYAPTRVVLAAGGGSFETAHVTLTEGVFLEDGPDVAERLVERMTQPCVPQRFDELRGAKGHTTAGAVACVAGAAR